jgi:hypothetical protein
MSIGEYLMTHKNIKKRVMGMASAGYANTVGASNLNDISLKRTTQYEKWWDENDGLDAV